jgi:phosphoribosylformylglycinamidine synthase
VLEAVEAGLVRSAHDLSEGGLAVSLAESAFHGVQKIGCEIDLDGPLRADAMLFGESQSRVVVTCRQKDVGPLLKLAARQGVPAMRIGRTGGAEITVRQSGRELLRVSIETAFRVWKDSLPGFFKVRT